MKGIYIVWALLGLALVLGLLPVGVLLRREEGGPLLVWLRIGPLRFRMLPEPDTPPQSPPPEQAPAPVPPLGTEGASGTDVPPAPEGEAPPPGPDRRRRERTKERKDRRSAAADVEGARRAVRILGPPLLRALRRLRRSVRVHPLDVTVVLGGAGDPAAAAVRYGRLQGALWGLMPRLEALVSIPRPHLRLEVDFSREEADLRGRAGVSARVGTLLCIAVSLAVPAIRLLRTRKKRAAAGKDDTNGHGKEQSAA